MTQKEFLENVRKAYLDARDCQFKSNNPAIIHRGTSHTISSLTEDLFACYCADKVKDVSNIKILIDPQLSFKGTGLLNKSGKKSLLVRPDVAICNKSLLTCFFDIKTDLGYKRHELLNQAISKNEQLKTIRGKSISSKDGKTKNPLPFTISNKIKSYYVVLSEGNIGATELKKFISDINKLENVGIFLLSKGRHLNNYDENGIWSINELDFDKLDMIITSALT